MFIISLHGIRLYGPLGLYAEEAILQNVIEVDVDVWVHAAKDAEASLVVDYTIVQEIVNAMFEKRPKLLETFVAETHRAIVGRFPGVGRVRVAARKLNPPMPGSVRYAQVVFENRVGSCCCDAPDDPCL